MKKLIAIFLVVFTMAMAVACDFSKNDSTSDLIPETETEQESNGDEIQGGENEEEKNQDDNVVKPITGGGDFNVGSDYNK